MDPKEVMAFFNTRPRNCLLITSNPNGDVNGAVYGSPNMVDENTIVLATKESRSYQYLRENPRAALIVVEPGVMGHDSKAVRVYMELMDIETEGELLAKFKKEVAGRAGEKAAEDLKAAIRFKITEIRPLIDPVS